jgi:hypothetical protein
LLVRLEAYDERMLSKRTVRAAGNVVEPAVKA